VAALLFGGLTQTGYIFDVELMSIAWRHSYSVAAVPVELP
jgi:hypothetical protein